MGLLVFVRARNPPSPAKGRAELELRELAEHRDKTGHEPEQNTHRHRPSPVQETIRDVAQQAANDYVRDQRKADRAQARERERRLLFHRAAAGSVGGRDGSNSSGIAPSRANAQSASAMRRAACPSPYGFAARAIA